MAQRQHAEHLIVMVKTKNFAGCNGVACKILVSEHRALGNARSARCVDDGANVVGIHSRLRHFEYLVQLVGVLLAEFEHRVPAFYALNVVE